MKLSPAIDLRRSLCQVFGNKPEFANEIEHDFQRQTQTAKAILHRFFTTTNRERRELMLLADEVGLGKTYVALAVAVSMLDSIRRGEAPDDLPANKPVVLILTPTNDALFNKWMREAEAFKKDCAHRDGDLDWLRICSPIYSSEATGNLIDISYQVREATRSQPMLLIAKQRVFGAPLHDRDLWRCRSLAALFGHFRTPTETRRYWCRKGRLFDQFGIPELEELLDLRRSGSLWNDPISTDLERAFARALRRVPGFEEKCKEALAGTNENAFSALLDDFARFALTGDWPPFPLVVIDEIHGLKNEHVQARRNLEAFAVGNVCRLLGLSATPFQLHHHELLSLLGLRRVLSLSKDRREALDQAVFGLGDTMKAARDSGDTFRRRWKALRPADQQLIEAAWTDILAVAEEDRRHRAALFRPPRIAHAISAALDLDRSNASLQQQLKPFVVRHQHRRGYREYFVGNRAALAGNRGSLTFSWSPGIEVTGDGELAQYVMMRAVALAKDERGFPGLGAELTGSYRHLVETAAIWRKLAQAKNPSLQHYRHLLDAMIGQRTVEDDPDSEHRKVQATVQRALEFFKRGQKSLIFCVYTKTAEAVRDHLQAAIDAFLNEKREEVFGGTNAFENFRRRFFNRREPLFSLIQDHPLLGDRGDGLVGVPKELALTDQHLTQIATLLVAQGEFAESEKPDRRLLIAAAEHIAVTWWRESPAGREWLHRVLPSCHELEDRIAERRWLEAREPLSRSERAGRARRAADPEAEKHVNDPLDAEDLDEGAQQGQTRTSVDEAIKAWKRRIRQEAIGEIVARYFEAGLISAEGRLPILAKHHLGLLTELDMDTRAVAGQVFRRILMADEFLLRYLADVEKNQTTRWAEFLSERYVKPLDGHLESLRDRVHAYLETLVRAKNNRPLLSGYHTGADNRNVVQLVKGDTPSRDRYFLGFNTPYRPEVLVSTSVGQEGIDLHRECRHVIHHDLCWNPATIEQRTGRVDRIGSKVERERLGGDAGAAPTLEIAVPYLAATYDERMFEELHRRAQLFEVTLGGEMRVEGRIDPEDAAREHRKEAGIGTEDEDLGQESEAGEIVALPADMVERLRINLAVWKPTDTASKAGECGTVGHAHQCSPAAANGDTGSS
ncbi:MAG TPA: DEAD/DEAH box helicase [Pirellulales bacterium]|nr:DEAD/DEAH box helicase [Pirellulales bacterium]